jgi:hypothetical protein
MSAQKAVKATEELLEDQVNPAQKSMKIEIMRQVKFKPLQTKA